jgi:hypothetical protein
MSVCPYCHGSGKFRHERPDVSDNYWIQMTGGTMRCPICNGKGKTRLRVNFMIRDNGLVFCRTIRGRTLVACPHDSCRKWVDVTSIIKFSNFRAKCRNGHIMVFKWQPIRVEDSKGR